MKPAPHTPGPWRVYQEKPHYYSVGTDYAHDRGHDCNIVRDIRCEANARVMAAAPELLNAIEELLPYLPDRNDALNYAATNDGRVGNVHVAVTKAVAAIRKARGC